MLSKSRSAAGESRYSAMRAAELALERACVEALWLAALFSFDQSGANHLDLCAALLLSSYEITDVFAIVGVVATANDCPKVSTGADHQNDGATDWDLQDDAIIEKVGRHGAQRTQQR